MRKDFAILALSALMALPAFSQQTKILTGEKHNEYGLVYSLPLTALRITVTAQKETFTAGPYSQYAKRFIGTSNVVSENSVKWTITDLQVTPFGVKDDERQYLMQLKPGVTTFIGVASDGMLLSVNTEPEETNPTGSGMKQVGARVLRQGGNVEDYLNYVNQDYLTAQNSMRQAEMLANTRMEVIEAYNEFINGTSDNMPETQGQLELMCEKLAEQRDAMSRAFTGTSSLEEFSSEYVYIPDGNGEAVLFRVSDFNGLVGADDYSGSPVYIGIEVTNEGALPKDPLTGEPKAFPKDGVVYGIPGSAKVSIYTDNRELFSKEFEFSQFGTTFGLSPLLFTDRKAPSYARFSPVTGALVEIGTLSKAPAAKTDTKSEE